MMQQTRRGLIIGGAALSAYALVHRPALAAVDPFTLGVASGEPNSDGFVLWTRLAPEPLIPDGSGGLSGDLPVKWEVATDPAMATVVARGEATAPDRFGRSVHVEVTGLRPDRPYWYRFTALGFQSPVGRARTAPGPGTSLAALKVVLASCAHWETGFFSAYRHMADEDPDLVIFLGDYIYEYSLVGARAANTVRRHDRSRECVDLASYRNRYALHRTDADLQRLHATAPCLATWDDHEVQNDYGADWSQFVGTAPEIFAARRIAAYQAFYEHMPLRRRAIPAADGSVRLFERFTFGDLAQISVLDARQHRSIQPCVRTGSRRGYVASCTDLADASRTMLGRDQEAWMAKGFAASAARWNLIAQPLMVGAFSETAPEGGRGYFTDGWSGYAAGRERMFKAIVASRLSNPVFFGGDLHAFMVSDLKDGAGRTLAAEFVGTSVTSDPAPDRLKADLPENPHVRFFDNASRGYLSADLTRERLAVRLRAITDRRDPAAGVSTLKSYVVESGRAGVSATG